MVDNQNMEQKQEQIRYHINPDVEVDTDREQHTMDIQIELPGVEKKDIELKMLSDSMYIKATRDDIEYSGEFYLREYVIPDKTTAKYMNGLLKVHAVMKNPMEDAKILTL
jgi:HSP20 family protein